MGWFDFLKPKNKQQPREVGEQASTPDADAQAAAPDTGAVSTRVAKNDRAAQYTGAGSSRSVPNAGIRPSAGTVSSRSARNARTRPGAGAVPSEEAGTAGALSNENKANIQAEFEILRYLDQIYGNPFIFLHEKRGQDNFLKKMDTFFSARPSMYDYWSKEGREIVTTVQDLFIQADVYADENGMRGSTKSKNRLIMILVLAGVLGFVLLSYIIPGMAGVSEVLLFVALCAICLVPNYVNRLMMKKSFKFMEEHVGAFLVDHPIEVIHDCTQYLLLDMREQLINSNIDLDKLPFQLVNSDYKGIKIMNSGKNAQVGTMVYAVQFLKDGEDPDEDVRSGMNTSRVDSDVDSDIDFDRDDSRDGVDDEDQDDDSLVDEP